MEWAGEAPAAVSKEKTHYELLGVTPDAQAQQIKQRFRELARTYHPDVNPGRPECHELFLRINEAYEVLSDPMRRARYDLDLRQKERRTADVQGGAYGSAPIYTRPSASGNGARPGTGPTASAKTGAGPAASPRTEKEQKERDRKLKEKARLLEDSQQSFRRGHLREAERLAREVLEIGRSGPAYELLGDVYSRQGKVAEAVEYYTLAAQLIPANGLIMAKLNRAAARLSGSESAYDLGWSRTGDPGGGKSEKRVIYQLMCTFFGTALMVLLLFWPGAQGDPTLGIPFVGHWTLSFLFRMFLCGLAVGGTLSVAGWVRPPDQELLYPSVRLPFVSVPLGLVLAVAGALFLPAALVLYLVLGFFQRLVTRSVMVAFTLCFALTILFMFNSPAEAPIETLFFGGNALFVSLLCGWFLGDLFRPSWVV